MQDDIQGLDFRGPKLTLTDCFRGVLVALIWGAGVVITKAALTDSTPACGRAVENDGAAVGGKDVG